MQSDDNLDFAISTLENYVRGELAEIRNGDYLALERKLCGRLKVRTDQLVYILIKQYFKEFEYRLGSCQTINKLSDENQRLRRAIDNIKDDPAYSKRAVQMGLNKQGVNSPTKKISNHEVEKCLRMGMSGKQIAEYYGVSEATVSRRRKEIEKADSKGS